MGPLTMTSAVTSEGVPADAGPVPVPPPVADGARDVVATGAGPTTWAAPHTQAQPRRYSPAPVLAVANQKGGVGKTTTAVSLSAALAERGLHVLLVDFDPQGNASSGLGLRATSEEPTIYDVVVDDTPITEATVVTSQPGLRLVRATIDLAGAEVELVSAFSREHKLLRALEPVRSTYDVVIVDCPPKPWSPHRQRTGSGNWSDRAHPVRVLRSGGSRGASPER